MDRKPWVATETFRWGTSRRSPPPYSNNQVGSHFKPTSMEDIILTIKISLITTTFCELGEPGEIFSLYQKLLDRLPLWLAKPLGACHKCFTGQVLFWFFLIRGSAVFELGFNVSLGIIVSLIINKIWESCEQ